MDFNRVFFSKTKAHKIAWIINTQPDKNVSGHADVYRIFDLEKTKRPIHSEVNTGVTVALQIHHYMFDVCV